jgi:hypothetical protein
MRHDLRLKAKVRSILLPTTQQKRGPPKKPQDFPVGYGEVESPE